MYHSKPLLPGAIERAREVLADAEKLTEGRFLQDPHAPVVYGRMQASLMELLCVVERKE